MMIIEEQSENHERRGLIERTSWHIFLGNIDNEPL